MFDISFSELIVIGVVAFLVLGPERLPTVARTVGHLLGRLQRYVNQVKADVSREMRLDELRKLQSDVTESVRSIEHSLNEETHSVGVSLNTADLPKSSLTMAKDTLGEAEKSGPIPAPPASKSADSDAQMALFDTPLDKKSH